MCTRWVFTVASEMKIFLAMARLVSRWTAIPAVGPRAAVSAGAGLLIRPISRAATSAPGRLPGCGGRHCLMDLFRRRVLQHVTAGPGLHRGQDIRIRVVGGQDQDRRSEIRHLIRAVAVTPSIPTPICRSMSTTSTRSPRICSRFSSFSAASPSAASAATEIPSKAVSIALRPARDNGVVVDQQNANILHYSPFSEVSSKRQADCHHRALPGCGFQVERTLSAATRSRNDRSPNRSHPAGPPVRAAGPADRSRRRRHKCPWSPRCPERRGSRRRCAARHAVPDVGEAGLGGPQQGHLVRLRQLHRFTVELEPAGHPSPRAAASISVPAEPAQTLHQGCPCNCGDDRPRTKLRASARFSEAVC